MATLESFDDVIALLVQGTNRHVCPEFRRNAPVGYRRLSAILDVGANAYDAFFNSPVGYRAQYCLGKENGLDQNRRLIQALKPLCLAVLSTNPDPELPTDLAVASLSGADAKVWIKDSDLPDTSDVHIVYTPWVTKAQAATRGSATDQAARAKAAVGVLAPQNSCLELKGAWVSDRGEEWRDPDKAFRACV